MANLTAKFRLIDEMSSRLDNIAQSGRNALSQWEQAGNAIDDAFGSAVVSTAQTAQSIDSSSTSIEDFTSSVNKATTETDKLSDSLDDINHSSDVAADAVEEFREESEEAGQKSKKFGEEATDALNSIEELLVGAGIVRGLQAIGQAYVDCIEDAIEFESAITGVYKTVDGTDEQLAAIAEETKALSLIIPSTTTEIAAVAEAAGQLGIATDDVMSFTEVMINLGEATNLTSDEAASSLAKFANITKMNSSEYQNLGSTVVALGNNFATTEADIVAMSTRMASAGSLAGLTEAEILALAASVSSVGIEADAGGSSMSTLLSKMQLAVETGSEELEQFASVANMTSEEFQKQWGESAVDALYAFIAGLNDTTRNGASATAILDEMGITEIRLSNAVKALASNHEGLNDAINLASNAWEENTALTKEAETRYATLESKLAMTQNAANNFSTAIGDVFAPTVSKGADVLADMLNGLTEFVKNHPTVVKANTAVVAGVAAFTVGIVAYTAAVKIAKVATTAFTQAMATNPYLLVGAAIAGVVVGLTTLAITMSDATDESEQLTASSRKQAQELENLKAEYAEACDTYGENSYEAWALKQEVDELSVAYENNKQTVEQLQTEIEGVTESLMEAREAYEEATNEIDNEYESSISLISKLEELSSSSEKAAANQSLIIPIVNELNERYADLDLTFDNLTGKFNMTAEEIRKIAEAEAKLKQAGIDYDRYVDAVGSESAAKSVLDNAKAELEAKVKAFRAAENAYLQASEYAAYSEYPAFATFWENIELVEAQKAYNEQKAVVDKLQGEYDNLITTITTFESAYGYTAETIEETNGSIITYEDAVSNSLSSVKGRVEELCTAYDEAYIAARESIDGQIGLFQEMVVEAETSVEEMQGAWESQVLYLSSYTENLKKAMEFGLDEALVASLSDGSEESAAYLDTIISKIEELGGTSDKAKDFVDDFNNQFQEVENAKDEFADTVADMETDFTEQMKEIEKQLAESIDNMNMEKDAAEAAKDTMSAYIQEIIDGGNSAVKEAESAAARVAAALETATSYGAGVEVYSDDFVGPLPEGAVRESSNPYAWMEGYASGTAYASPGVHLVGENGPELVSFNGGETVYPADETSRILARVADSQFRTSETTAVNVKEERTDDKGDSKTIRLEINGSGAIEVDNTMDEETVVSILSAHLKPVLTSIVKQEIYEEGDLAYDY